MRIPLSLSRSLALFRVLVICSSDVSLLSWVQ
jgi:hypothetical protein